MFTFLTAGESHGKKLTAIVKKVPAEMALTEEVINRDLSRRQRGYGRGGRMQIEQDRVQITSGVRHGVTIGSPLTLQIMNRDWENWQAEMAIACNDSSIQKPLTQPRPGHADLVGGIKYHTHDLRNILERASARETAIRTAVGAVCRQFLQQFAIQIWSHVIQIGDRKAENWQQITEVKRKVEPGVLAQVAEYFASVEDSLLRCADKKAEMEMIQLIDAWRQEGDSVGGQFEIIVTGLPPGLGSHIQWDERLDGQLAQGLMSIQGIKSVEIGLGVLGSTLPGSKVHDEIYYDKQGDFRRRTNRAGGLEGGMTTGEPLVLRLAMKPIPTLMKPLRSVDVVTKKEVSASKERADVCAVPAASVVGEGVIAGVLARAFCQKFAGDSLSEIKRNYQGYLEEVYRY